MKKILTIFLFSLIFSTFSTTILNAEPRKIYRFGSNPLSDKPLETPEQFRKLIEKEIGVVALVLGNESDFYKFCENWRKAKVEETTIEPGEVIEVMPFKKNGIRMIEKNLVYSGKEPAPAYQIRVPNTNIILQAPKRCGNIYPKKELKPEKTEPKISEEPKVEEKPKKKVITQKPKEEVIVREPKEEGVITSEGIGKLRETISETRKSYLIFRIGTGVVEEQLGNLGKYIRLEDGGIFYLGKGSNLGRSSIMVKTGISVPVENRDKWRMMMNLDVLYRYRILDLSLGAGLGFSTKVQAGKADRGEFLLSFGWKGFFVEGRVPTNNISFKIFKVILNYQIII